MDIQAPGGSITKRIADFVTQVRQVDDNLAKPGRREVFQVMAKAVGEGCVAGWEAANYSLKQKREEG